MSKDNIENLKNGANSKLRPLADLNELIDCLGDIAAELHYLNAMVKLTLTKQKLVNDFELKELDQEMENDAENPGADE